jgi:hypothetical protein
MAFPTSQTKWKTIRDTYYSSTDRVSNSVRTYAIAAIAIVWVFKTGDGSPTSPYQFDSNLLWGAGLIVVTLGLDLLQYAYKSTAWMIARVKVHKDNKDPGDDDPFEVWDDINFLTDVLFFAKLVALLAGYFFIGCFMYGYLFPS